MRDRRQKEAALRYILNKKWFPQLELSVHPNKSSNEASYELTDIDVYSVIPDEIDGYKNILFDCKSGKHASPISRAFWLKGLVDYTGSEKGICILSSDKNISIDHKNTASEIDVSLMTLDEFSSFASSTGGNAENSESNLSSIDNWEKYFSFYDKYNQIEDGFEFALKDYWNFNTPGDACRNSIAKVRDIRGEMDPSKKPHMVLFGDLLSLFLLSAAKISHGLFTSYLQPSEKNDLEEVLLSEVYNGKETYKLLNNIRRAIPSENSKSTELAVPDWNEFVHLIRSMMESPLQALYAPLLARETAWSLLSDNSDFSFAREIALEKPQAGKFCLIGTRYLCEAGQLPPEFGDLYQEVFMPLQSTSRTDDKDIQKTFDF